MKTIYFTDWEYADKVILHEMDEIMNQLEDFGVNGIELTEFVQVPPFKGHSEERYYDIMFFDFGGAMEVCYSTVSNFIECILREAKECPERYYVVTSTFSMLLDEFDDLVSREFGDDKPYNVFLSIEKFCEFYKKIQNV